MRFVWRECGRAMVARFGNLSVSVRCTGSRKRGDLRWGVDRVFGNAFLGAGLTYSDVGDAIREAEGLATREAKALAALLKHALGAGRGDAGRDHGE